MFSWHFQDFRVVEINFPTICVFEEEFSTRKTTKKCGRAGRKSPGFTSTSSLHNFQPFSYLNVKHRSISHCYSTNKIFLVFFVLIGASHLPFPFGPCFSLTNYPQTIAHSKVINVVACVSIFRLASAKKSEEKNSQIRARWIRRGGNLAASLANSTNFPLF